MSVPNLLAAGLVVFVTHALEAVTGFGCTVLALPFITALLGLRAGVKVLTILAWILALYISAAKRKSIDLRQFGIILGFVLLGLPVGMYLFRRVEAGVLKRFLAAFIVVASSIQLAKPIVAGRRRARVVDDAGASEVSLSVAAPESAPDGKPVRGGAPRWPYFALLAAGGVVHGMFSSGGPFVVLYASKALPDKSAFRATLTLLWATLNTVLIAGYLAEGSLDAETGMATAVLLPFLAGGILIGDRLHDKASPAVFTTLVFAMLFVTGVVMFFF